ncbi:MAG: ABC transporter permease [Candidatus Brocadiia bacterium]|jgi:phospholipid/cholesterol/gamma-HCH transport system permease protein|nr:ABC transporter permease [Candidatus Brocadiia bacterium]
MSNAFVGACTTAHDVAALFLQSLRHAGYAVKRHKLLFRQLYEVGNRSLLIVTLLGLFIGMSLALQSGYQLRKLNQERLIGLLGIAIIKEFGPVITAFLLAGRIGSSYAAEIGTMKVYEEVDALTVMGVQPVAYLASPRVLACLLMLPILVIYADFVALLGGALVARTYVGVQPSAFFAQFFQWMSMTEVWRSMVKCLFFGSIVAVTGCHFGFRTSGGAEGVGRSTTDSVVYAILAVLVSDYFLEKVLLAF